VAPHLGSRQRRPSQNWPWGPKLPQVQNLGGSFVVIFLGGQNRNFGKVKGLKLLLSLFFREPKKNFSLHFATPVSSSCLENIHIKTCIDLQKSSLVEK